MQRHGWHPFLRLNAQGTVRQAGRDDYQALTSLTPADGSVWSGRVTCFQSQQQLVDTTLLLAHAEGYQDTWFVVTDLQSQQRMLAWYAMRFWIEVGFKQLKRAGWQWQHSKMTDPRRVERYWLVMALTTLWTVSMGQQGEAALPVSSLQDLPLTHIARQQFKGRPQRALLSQFTLGRLWLMRTMVEHEPLSIGFFAPSPWPQDLPTFPHRRRKPRQQKKSRAQRKRWQQRYRTRNKQKGQHAALKNLPL